MNPPPLKGVYVFFQLPTHDYIVLLFQLVLAQVILPPVKLSPSLSTTSKDTTLEHVHEMKRMEGRGFKSHLGLRFFPTMH